MPTLLSIEALEADKRYVEQQIAESERSPWGTAALMWQNRLAEIDAQIEAAAAQRSNYASVAVIFDGNPVIGTNDIRLDFTADALDSYQKLVSLTLASKMTDDLPQRGPLPGMDQSRLFIRDLVRGSMGFILEELPPDQHSMLPTHLKDAVENTTQLIASLSNLADEEFEATIANTQPRLVAAVQRFAKVLFEAGASTRIVGDDQRIALSIDEVGRLSRRLGEVEVKEEIVAIDGVLMGILPEAKKFELKLPGDDLPSMQGTVADDLVVKYTSDTAFKERLLLQPVRAQVKVIQTTRNGRLVRERRILEALEPTAAER